MSTASHDHPPLVLHSFLRASAATMCYAPGLHHLLCCIRVPAMQSLLLRLDALRPEEDENSLASSQKFFCNHGFGPSQPRISNQPHSDEASNPASKFLQKRPTASNFYTKEMLIHRPASWFLKHTARNWQKSRLCFYPPVSIYRIHHGTAF